MVDWSSVDSSTLPGALPPIVGALPSGAFLVDVRTDTTYDREAIWREAWRRAKRIASYGNSHGPIVVAEPNGVSTLLCLFGAWTAGLPAIVADPTLTAEEKSRVCRATGASLWIGPEAPEQSTPVALSERGNAKGLLPLTRLGWDDPALILMTSGTTEMPKGVVHSLRSLSVRIALNLSFMPSDDLERTLDILPVHFGHGLVGNCLTPLVAGARLYVWAGLATSEYHEIGAFLDREKITFMSSVPSFWQVAMRLSQPPKKALKRVHIGSAPLYVEQWRSVADWVGTPRALNMYGMTETANWIGGRGLEQGDIADGLVGRPWGGRFAVCSEGKIAMQGEGEVLVQSPSLMLGYLGRELETEEDFVGAWFRTGDLGRLGDDGELCLVGRIKEEINRAGVKVSPAEVEALLARHPDVEEACVFALPDPVAGETVAAAIVYAESSSAAPDHIHAWCRERIRGDALPAQVFVLSELPRTDRGKIDRKAVRETALRCGARK